MGAAAMGITAALRARHGDCAEPRLLSDAGSDAGSDARAAHKAGWLEAGA
jgi:hypothetical protein